MSFDVALRVSRISKHYRLFERPRHRLIQPFLRKRKLYQDFCALRDVSFRVARGETVGIIGRNGSGKSTLLQIIAGTLAPTTGRVVVKGRIAALLELGSGFDPEFTGRENVMLNGVLLGINRQEMERRFDDIASFADIGSFIDQPVKTYSSGMLVRLAFAVSVNVAPEVLIVDEALSVGDAVFQFKCMERLEQVTASGATLLLVSHDMTLMKTYCDRVIYLRDGSVRQCGRPQDVVEQYLMDSRDDQMRSVGGVVRKPALSGKSGMAFGSERGRVVRAEFADAGGMQSTFVTGGAAAVLVEAEFSAQVRAPHLVILVQDRKRVTLGGQSLRIEASPDAAGGCWARLRCSFRVRLAAGRYFVTIRLEDQGAGGAALLIDKQPAALTFDVVGRVASGFLGVVDLDMDIAQQLPLTESAGGPMDTHRRSSGA